MIKFIASTLLTLACGLAFAAVDVNKASQAELESVKGIGPGLSTKILAARQTGPFADWNDLQTRVKGVGHGNAVKFSADGLTVAGAAYAATASAAKPASTKTRAVKTPEASKPAGPKAQAAASK